MTQDARLRRFRGGGYGGEPDARSADGNIPVITSRTGSTAGGMPLAFNRTPRESLRPWIMRMAVTDVTLPPGQRIECRTFNEHPVMRVIFGGRWTAKTATGTVDFSPEERGLALFFGPNARHMPLIAHGSFRVVTINFAPGASGAFRLPPQPDTVDHIFRYDPIARNGAVVMDGYRPLADKREWLDAAESAIESALMALSPPRPEPLMTAFETLCFADAGGSIERFAREHAITRRTLERTISRTWGVSPGEALRRARALDMAAVLLGVALEEEEQELRLRYFDQSHLIREMRRYFDMTPGQLQTMPHPLLRIQVEIRQARRVEMLARIGAGETLPWRDPGAEPEEQPNSPIPGKI